MSLPREGARTTRDGIVVSAAMDWCRSPQAIVPYRIHTQGQIEGACTVASVRQNDEPSYVSNSLIKPCYGDEAGTGGGVLSSTHGGKSEPTSPRLPFGRCDAIFANCSSVSQNWFIAPRR